MSHTVYVAGPMRRYKSLNFPKFAEVTAKLRALGYEVISPAEEDLKEGLDPDNPPEFTTELYEAWMARDFEFLRTCRYICLLPDWQNSPGALREYEYAMLLGLGIMYACDLED